MEKQIYLVGGAVRDQLMGVEAHDRDYVVVGSSPEEMIKLGYQSVGTDFPVFLHPETKEEYALARTERKTGRGYKGFSFDAGTTVTLEQDLARRDLTINAMAKSETGNIIDPFNGQVDLANQCLHHTTQAFSEDPVRVLRIARFWARFGPAWHIHSETLSLINTMKDDGELRYLVAERVWAELQKALGEPYPCLFFKCLKGLGIFAQLDGLDPDEYEDLLDSLQFAANLNFETETRFAVFAAALCTDTTMTATDETQSQVLADFCRQWRVPKKYEKLAILTATNLTNGHNIESLCAEDLYSLLLEHFNVFDDPETFLQFMDACQSRAHSTTEACSKTQYASKSFAVSLIEALSSFDRKAAVQSALSDGMKGRQIGEAVKVSITTFIEHWLAKHA